MHFTGAVSMDENLLNKIWFDVLRWCIIVIFSLNLYFDAKQNVDFSRLNSLGQDLKILLVILIDKNRLVYFQMEIDET